jgi:hypothetical protein
MPYSRFLYKDGQLQRRLPVVQSGVRLAYWYSIIVSSKALTNYLINSIEQSPSSDANSRLATQEIPRLLRNPNVHYRLYKIPPLGPILSQTNLVHTPLPYFFKIHSVRIFPYTPRSSKMSLPLWFFDQKSLRSYYFSHACAIPSRLFSIHTIKSQSRIL